MRALQVHLPEVARLIGTGFVFAKWNGSQLSAMAGLYKLAPGELRKVTFWSPNNASPPKSREPCAYSTGCKFVETSCWKNILRNATQYNLDVNIIQRDLLQ